MDLNLVVVFEALLAERSATRAGRRLGLSQSAVSNALARLRQAVGDPLFVRAGATMAPTATALRLATPLAAGLAELRAAFATPARFDARRAQHTTRIATTDYGERVALAPLVRRLRRDAPGFALVCRRLQRMFELPLAALERGELDFALGDFGALPPGHGLRSRRLFVDRWVVLAARGRRAPTRAQFAARPQVKVIYSGEAPGIVGEALERLGLDRLTPVVTPHQAGLADYVEDTDLVAVLPLRLARRVARARRLTVHRLPLPLPPLVMTLVWREPREREPAHHFVVELLARVTRRAA